MTRIEKRNAEKEEQLKKLAIRILSVGISIVIVGGVTKFFIGQELNKKRNPIEKEPIHSYVPIFSELPEITIKQNYPDDIDHLVQKNDNLIRICKKYNIDPNYYLMLAYYNQINNPNMIFEGDIIKVPVEEKLLEKAIAGINNGHPLLSSKYHHVKEGERLYNICQAKFGNGEYAYALAHWQQIDPNNLQVNQIIYLLTKEELDIYIASNHEQIEEFKSFFTNEKIRHL